MSNDELETYIHKMPINNLPEAHMKLVEIIGVDATLKLCKKYGGGSINIPLGLNTARGISASSKVIRAIGSDATKALINEFGGELRYIPTYKSLMECVKRDVIRIKSESISVRELAREFGVSDRTIQRIIKEKAHK